MKLIEFIKNHYPNNKYIIGPNWIILQPNEQEQKIESKKQIYHSTERKCLLCKTNFDYGQTRKIICNCCKIFSVCLSCDKIFEINFNNYSGTKRKLLIDNILNNKSIEISCGYSCSNLNRKKFGKCPYCGKENVDIYNGRCSFCANKELNSSIICKIHGFQNSSFAGKCILCINNKKDYKKESELRKKTILQMIENHEIERWPGICLPNFITKDNVRYYKGIEVNEFSKKILSGELNINNYSGINIRFNRVCYGSEDIITSQKLLKVSKFEIKDNVRYFYDRSIQDYIPWEDYKKKFIIQSNDYMSINKILISLPGFKLYPTFRKQDSDFWSDGSKSAFEQSLVDDNIMWFTYIKFYISHNNSKIEEIASIRPLVVGKSGSLLVNSSGSDLSFSTDINDGPARRFLAESNNNSSWDKTKIAILPCKNELEAFEKESYYLQKLNIFSS